MDFQLMIKGSVWTVAVSKFTDEDDFPEEAEGMTYPAEKKVYLSTEIFKETNKKENVLSHLLLTFRHEIIHSLLYECGLDSQTLSPAIGWACNEEMVDWFAIQLPELNKIIELGTEIIKDSFDELWDEYGEQKS